MILIGDALDQLLTLPSESVQCCITSPPYWGLRDYGIDGQIGLERSHQEYIKKLCDVFWEVLRVLRNDGTLWLNLGDRYEGKDLCGIPWHVAFSLKNLGWFLRQDIIWSKSNPMPESVRDRCTKSHEYIFLLSKRPKYFFDHKAILESAVCSDEAIWDNGQNGMGGGKSYRGSGSSTRKFRSGNKERKYGADRGRPGSHLGGSIPWESDPERIQRNRRSVWTIGTEPFPEAHFATFPRKLVEPMILAGTKSGDQVLDPFCGSGTVGVVATGFGRRFIGIELNPEYAVMAERRINNSFPLLQIHNGP